MQLANGTVLRSGDFEDLQRGDYDTNTSSFHNLAFVRIADGSFSDQYTRNVQGTYLRKRLCRQTESQECAIFCPGSFVSDDDGLCLSQNMY